MEIKKPEIIAINTSVTTFSTYFFFKGFIIIKYKSKVDA